MKTYKIASKKVASKINTNKINTNKINTKMSGRSLGSLSVVLLSSMFLLQQSGQGAEKALPAARVPAVKVPSADMIRLHFVKTDVGIVLSALGTRTHANIIYSTEKKRDITINIAAPSLEEALRSVSAAAGLEYRQVGRMYVVSTPADLRQALKPFAATVSFTPVGFTAEEGVKLVESALPYVTVRVAGNRLLVSGAEMDIAQAQTLLAASGSPSVLKAPQESAVIAVRNVSAPQIALVLKSMYPALHAEAVGSVDKIGGTVGLSGDHSLLEEVKTTVTALDIPAGPTPVLRAFRLYAIKFSSAPILRAFLASAMPGLGVIIGPETYAPIAPSFRPLSGSSVGLVASTSGSGAGGNGSGGSGSQTATGESGQNGLLDKNKEGQRAKTLVLSGTPEELDSASKLLLQLDTPPQQVMVDVKVVDTSPQFAEELGLSYNFAPIAIGNVAPGSTIDPATGLQNPGTTVPFNFATFSRLGLGVSALLNAVKTRTDTKLLADPRVQVIDNEDANIFIGDTVRTQVSQSSLNGTTIQVLEFPVGIILLVRPRVNSDGKITLRVHPVVSTITGFSAGNLPQSSSREVETTVMVQDGETIVIGGLIRDEYSKIIQEVPFLSKLPLIGELFRNRSTNRRHSDVMIFITPHIVKNP